MRGIVWKSCAVARHYRIPNNMGVSDSWYWKKKKRRKKVYGGEAPTVKNVLMVRNVNEHGKKMFLSLQSIPYYYLMICVRKPSLQGVKEVC